MDCCTEQSHQLIIVDSDRLWITQHSYRYQTDIQSSFETHAVDFINIRFIPAFLNPFFYFIFHSFYTEVLKP